MSPVLLLTASIAIVGSNSLAISPIAAAISQSLPGSSPADVTIASALYGFGTAISALTMAPHADRLGLAKALRLAVTMLAIALAVSSAATSLIVLCAAQFLAGLAAGVALPATYGLAAEIAPKGQESRTLGKVLTGWTLSMVAGVSLSALFADLVHWRGVFLLLALCAALIALALRHSAKLQNRPASNSPTSPLEALRVPGLLPPLLVCSSYMIAFYGVYAFLGPHMSDKLGLTTAFVGLAPLAYGVGFGLAAPLDRFIDRYGATRVSPAVFGALMIIYLAIAAVAADVVLLIVLSGIWGVVNHLGLNLIVGRLTALSPAQRATIMGLYSAVTYISMFIGTASFKFLYDPYGFVACAIVGAACIVPALLESLAQRHRNRSARQTV